MLMSLFLQVELSACHSKIKQEISAREKVEAQVLEVQTVLVHLSTWTIDLPVGQQHENFHHRV